MSEKVESVKERLRRIYELSEHGTGGEKENAKRMLEALLKKHKISLEELLSEKTDWYDFTYKTDAQKQLLYQIFFMILKVKTFSYRKLRRSRGMSIKMTEAQAIDVREHFNHYRPALERHLQEAVEAFVHANEIYSPDADDDKERPELTEEQLARLRRIMGMTVATAPTPPLRKMLVS